MQSYTRRSGYRRRFENTVFPVSRTMPVASAYGIRSHTSESMQEKNVLCVAEITEEAIRMMADARTEVFIMTVVN
jgi:hypothetical protein